MADFHSKLMKAARQQNSLLCIGLDSDLVKIPPHLQANSHPQFEFNKAIIEATHDLVCAYKPNSAFYEARGAEGIAELKLTCDYLRATYPDIPIILDAKRGDIGSTNIGYVQFAYDYLGADAITLHPYLGKEALEPFLAREDKGCIILCRTSNPGAGEVQDVVLAPPPQVGSATHYSLAKQETTILLQGKNVKENISSLDKEEQAESRGGLTLYQDIALQVKDHWNTNGNCLLVIGATYPQELAEIRKLCPEMTFLVPGIGAQGGDLEKTLKAGLKADGTGLIINSSRGVIFAGYGEKFDEKARVEAHELRNTINRSRS